MLEVKNTADLRKMLLEVIEHLRDGKVDSQTAGAICNLSGRILDSAKLDLQVAKAAQIQGEIGIEPIKLVDGAGTTRILPSLKNKTASRPDDKCPHGVPVSQRCKPCET